MGSICSNPCELLFLAQNICMKVYKTDSLANVANKSLLHW